MNDAAAQRLRELLWRSRLTEAETAELQSLLSANPEAAVDCATEQALTQALETLPEAPPVATNFTALVMQEIERDAKIRTRTDNRWSLRGWLPRMAFGCLVLGVGFASWHQHQMTARAAMARDVAQLGAALLVSAPELSQNLNTIRRLDGSAPKADTELLTLMQ
jgi:hypothetical protein